MFCRGWAGHVEHQTTVFERVSGVHAETVRDGRPRPVAELAVQAVVSARRPMVCHSRGLTTRTRACTHARQFRNKSTKSEFWVGVPRTRAAYLAAVLRRRRSIHIHPILQSWFSWNGLPSFPPHVPYMYASPASPDIEIFRAIPFDSSLPIPRYK